MSSLHLLKRQQNKRKRIVGELDDDDEELNNFKRHCYAMIANAIPGGEGFWSRPKSGHCWNDMMVIHGSDERFKTTYRMDRKLFYTLCAKIESRVGKEDTRFRPAVDTPRRLAIFLEFLATGPTYNTLAEHCGVSRTNVFDIIEDVADAIIAVLKGDMRFPSDPTTIKDLEMGFRELWGLPGACGAIDGSHFPIMKPSENGDDNLNRKKYPSVAGLFVASSECYCLDMVVGWPGSTHDSRMWRNMSLRGRMLDGDVPLRTMPPVQFGGQQVPYFLLADPGFSLSELLVPTFDRRGTLSSQHRSFNTRHSRAS